ncbi:hypothetical protein QBC44DRAFT_307071 [Cladorrhinum sp. PSN332]|nr:hypothetical protein QBC44DRAFT_307071 [Cladorrhinum sp. PSN332]
MRFNHLAFITTSSLVALVGLLGFSMAKKVHPCDPSDIMYIGDYTTHDSPWYWDCQYITSSVAYIELTFEQPYWCEIRQTCNLSLHYGSGQLGHSMTVTNAQLSDTLALLLKMGGRKFKDDNLTRIEGFGDIICNLDTTNFEFKVIPGAVPTQYYDLPWT